jgi:hypothetical protein
MKHLKPLIALIALLIFFFSNSIYITSEVDPVTRTVKFVVRDEFSIGQVYGENTNYTEARLTPTESRWGAVLVGQFNDAGTYTVYRGFLKFNTANIPSGASFQSVKLFFYSINFNASRDFILRIRKWTGVSPLGVEDYLLFDNTNYDDGSFHANATNPGWNSITISNFDLINIGGDTKICLLSSRDLNADPPPGFEYIEMFHYYEYLPYLEITYTYTPIGTVVPKWLLGGYNGRIMAIEGDGEILIDLKSELATDLDIQVIENGFGYYLIGLNDWRGLSPYQYPSYVPRLYKYDGNTFTPLGANGVQIMDICKFGDKFLIGGFVGGGAIAYPSPVLYTYDGVTLKDVTDEIIGDFVPVLDTYGISSIEDCGNYILMGLRYSRDLGELVKYDKKTGEFEELLVPKQGGPSPPSIPAIAYDGKSALIGFPLYGYNGSTVWQYNGTLKKLEDEIGGIGWFSQCITTNGTHFLMGGNYLHCYDGINIILLNDTLRWNAIGWNGKYWLLATDGGLWKYENGQWSDWSQSLPFTPLTLAPGAFRVYVDSQPEANAKFEFQGGVYTTPTRITCYQGTYFFAVKDISVKIEETPLLFSYITYEASPPTQIYSAATTLNINSDANITIVYSSGFKREEWQPVPVPEEKEGYCLPLIFYLIMICALVFDFYFFIRRETWKISMTLIPIAFWLIIFEPKTPISQMPIAILRLFTVPPWHLYMAIILTAVACLALLSSSGKFLKD